MAGPRAQDRSRAEPREVPQRCPAGWNSSGHCDLLISAMVSGGFEKTVRCVRTWCRSYFSAR